MPILSASELFVVQQVMFVWQGDQCYIPSPNFLVACLKVQTGRFLPLLLQKTA